MATIQLKEKKAKFTSETIRDVEYFISQRAEQNADDSLGVAHLFHAIKVIDYAEQDQRVHDHFFEWLYGFGHSLIPILNLRNCLLIIYSEREREKSDLIY